MSKLTFPDMIEYNYSKELKKIIKVMEKKLKKIVTQKSNSSLIESEKEEFLEYMVEYLAHDFCLELAVNYSLEVVEYSITQVNNQIKEVKGINFKEQAFYDESIIKNQIKEQVKLIKAEPGKYLRTFDKQVAKLVKDSVEEGLSTKTLSKAIKLATGVEERRANLIARDQIGKVFGEATKAQQKGIGLKTFEWVDVGDSRVRSSHKSRAGNIYEWDNPPDGEIPGVPIACRCIGAVVPSEVLGL